MDIGYLLFLQNLREATNGIFDSFFMFITDVGWSIIPFLVMAGMYWCIDKRNGIYMIMNGYIGAWVNGIVKLTACVYRPWVRSSDVKPLTAAYNTATGYSFPSGHMANGVAVWGGMAVAYRRNKCLRNILILLVVLIGFSRNYVGVHTPQDVLVSGVVGIALLFATYKMLQWIEKDAKREKWILISSALMCIFMILYASFKPYPMDYVDGVLLVDPKKMALDSWASGGEILGFGVAWFAERKWVNFSVEGTVAERIQRFVIGALLFSVLFYTVCPILMLILPKEAAYFITKMMMSLFIVLLFPMWFSRKKKA